MGVEMLLEECRRLAHVKSWRAVEERRDGGGGRGGGGSSGSSGVEDEVAVGTRRRCESDESGRGRWEGAAECRYGGGGIRRRW